VEWGARRSGEWGGLKMTRQRSAVRRARFIRKKAAGARETWPRGEEGKKKFGKAILTRVKYCLHTLRIFFANDNERVFLNSGELQ